MLLRLFVSELGSRVVQLVLLLLSLLLLLRLLLIARGRPGHCCNWGC